MLRVAQITLGLEVGGLERLLVEMARHRDVSRFDWTVFVLGGRGPLADELEDAGVRVMALGEPAGIRPGLWRRLARLLQEERFDVVHTHNERPLIYAMPAAWWAGVPRRIHTRHHGRFGDIRWRQQMLLRWAARFVQDYICVSRDGARYVIEQGLAAARVQTLWNGIDLTRFAFQGPCDDGPIVTVARLSPEKDIANLLRAARRVISEFPQTRFEIAGDGPCRSELVELARDLQLTEYVTFHGEMRDIPSLLSRARLFVLPSKTEGISLTLLEAMARGLPIVTTDVGGNPEVVEAGVTGRLAPPGDPEGLARAITSMLADDTQSRQMGIAGRRRVEDWFDVRRMMAAYEGLYACDWLREGVDEQGAMAGNLVEAK